MFKRLINIAILIAGLYFVSHFWGQANAQVSQIQKSVHQITSR